MVTTLGGTLAALRVNETSSGILCLRSLLENPLPIALPMRIHFVGFVSVGLSGLRIYTHHMESGRNVHK